MVGLLSCFGVDFAVRIDNFLSVINVGLLISFKKYFGM